MDQTDDRLKRELNFIVLRYLQSTGCSDAYEVFRQYLDTNNQSTLPQQFTWFNSQLRSTSVAEIERQNPHIQREFLFDSLKNCVQALNQVSPRNQLIRKHQSFLAPGESSLTRNFVEPEKNHEPATLLRLSHYPNGSSSVTPVECPSLFPPNVITALAAREISGYRPIHHLLPTSHYQNFKKHRRLLGHLSSVYCLIFDRTGRYIITGADDKLVKIWSALDGRLLMTLRGHSEEISDLTIDPENTMIASSSCDKTIRVWNLKNASPVTVLSGHTGHINNLNFCPLMKWPDKRYLVSTGNDGCICFWEYNPNTKEFKAEPLKYLERKKGNSQIMYSTFSTGGEFMAMGTSDNHLYVFHIGAPNVPVKIFETDAHIGDVDSIMFSNRSMRFVSGAKDGIALIWRYEKQTWKNIKLRMDERLPGTSDPAMNSNDPKRNSTGLRVSMVGWTCDDAHVITSVNDNTIKVWDSKTGELIHILYGHEQEVFVIEGHPTDPRIFLSGGHEGAINIWDVVSGQNLQTFFNAIEGQGHGAIFDCKWSPDGLMFASTDSHGHITFFGVGPSDDYQKMPEHAFFHTDYRPLAVDRAGYALDDQNQVAPHLMGPPFLVDIDGNPYSPDIQRLVPGRESFSDNQLVPYVSNSFMDAEPAEASATVTSAPPAEADANSVLDDRIRQMVRESLPNSNSGVNNTNNNNAPSAHPAPGQNRNISNRRSGDVEGVRQSANFITRGNQQARSVWKRHDLVPPLDSGTWRCLRDKLNKMAQDEENNFEVERKKRPDIEEIVTDRKETIVTRRRQRIAIQSRGVLEGNALEFDVDDELDHDFVARSTSSSSDEDEEEDTLSFHSDDSDDSDFAPHQRRRPKPKEERSHDTVTSYGRRSRRVINSSGDERTNNHSYESERSQVRRKKKQPARRRIDSDDERPSPPHRAAPPPQPSSSAPRHIPYTNGGISELPESYRPPEWLTDTKPKRSPYFPQIGDEVVYFRSGHQEYFDKVRDRAIYTLPANSRPFKLRGSDSDEIFARVKAIRYHIRPEARLVELTMEVMSPDGDEEVDTKATFKIKYHDVENVCDFIILKELYDRSIGREWRTGDDFRSVIDDKWWTGKILTISQNEPHSFFKCFGVLWSSGEEENLSPWDLEPITRGKRASTSAEQNCEGRPLTEEERIIYNSFECNDITDEERTRLLDGFIRIMQFSQSEMLICPVDLNENPLYAMTIPYPIDLSTIKSRIENKFYRRKEAIQCDASYIYIDAELYNEPSSEIVKQAKIVSDVCKRFIDDVNCFDPTSILIELQAEGGSRASDDASTDIEESPNSIRSQTTTRSNRVVRRPERFSENENEQSEDDNRVIRVRSWKQNCRELLDYLFSLHDSQPFRHAVDPVQYPEYLSVIDTPMDLTLVKEDLLAGNYKTPVDFCKDMRLIFTNSKFFNTNKRSQIYAMTIRLSTLFEEKMRKILSDWRGTNRVQQRGFVSRRNIPFNQFQADQNEPGPSTSRRKREYSSPTEDSRTKRARTSKRQYSDVEVEDYSSRDRYKRTRRYNKHDSDSENERPKNGRTRLSNGRRTTKRVRYNDDDFDDDEEEEIPKRKEPIRTKSGRLVRSSQHQSEDEEEERDDVQDDEDDDDDVEEDNETESETDEDEEESDEIDDKDDDGDDTDATQVDEDDDDDGTDKENDETNPRRSRRVVKARDFYQDDNSRSSNGSATGVRRSQRRKMDCFRTKGGQLQKIKF